MTAESPRLERVLLVALAVKRDYDVAFVLGRVPTPEECMAQAEWEVDGNKGLCPGLRYPRQKLGDA